jgi:hypothetical protein
MNTPLTYNVDYFIQKFTAIPEDEWIEDGTLSDGRGKYCALGHCFEIGEVTDLRSLMKIIPAYTSRVNDGIDSRYPQPTPKQRILAALEDIKRAQQQ